MVLGKGALAVKGGHDRRLQRGFGQPAQLVGRFSIKDALTREDHRTGGVEQHFCGLVDVALVGGGPGSANRAMHVRVDINLDAGHICRHLHHDWPRPPVFHLGKGAPHDVADLVRQLHFLDRFGDRGVGAARFEHWKQLRRLARMAERQEDNRRQIGKGGGDPNKGIPRPPARTASPRRRAGGRWRRGRKPSAAMDADPHLAGR